MIGRDKVIQDHWLCCLLLLAPRAFFEIRVFSVDLSWVCISGVQPFPEKKGFRTKDNLWRNQLLHILYMDVPRSNIISFNLRLQFYQLTYAACMQIPILVCNSQKGLKLNVNEFARTMSWCPFHMLNFLMPLLRCLWPGFHLWWLTDLCIRGYIIVIILGPCLYNIHYTCATCDVRTHAVPNIEFPNL